VRRWIGAFGAAVVGCVLVLLHRSSSSDLLQDTDTRVLLETIRARHAPFSWFGGDWPLMNHFYRPVSTLSFELDNHLYRNAAWGYGFTNALLCVACTLLLFWFLRELTNQPILTGCATLLFALWETSQGYRLSPLFDWLAIAIVVGGVVRHRLQIRMWFPAAFVAWEVSIQLSLAKPIETRTLTWLPGRTALVMTVFVLAALAAYARYERLSANRKEPEPTPLDPPATRSATSPASRPSQLVLGVWMAFCLVCTFLAMASYEQAIMLPALLLATACTFRWRGYMVRWGWQGAFWGVLVGYLALRHALVSSAPSHYQLQQFRSGPGVWVSLSAYTFPSLFALGTMGAWVTMLPMTLLTPEPWQTLFSVGCDVATVTRVRRRWVLTFAGFGMAFLGFLPMAWVKEFMHYHYLPLAMKSLFVTMLAWIAFEGAVSAWSPQARQAPPRHDPAPGSLPHP
jgi:hypothetical protein